MPTTDSTAGKPGGATEEGHAADRGTPAEEPTAAGERPCSVCKATKGPDSFSKKQWAAKAHSRRCKDCVVAAGAEESQSEKPTKQAGTNGAGSMSGAAEKKEESELCALVRAILFANPQWGLKKVTKEVASKMRDLGRPPVQPSEVKDAWKTLGLDNEEEVIKFFTVGNAAAQAAADAETDAGAGEAEQGDAEAGADKWFAVQLDVAAVRSGERPHQAVMSHHTARGGLKKTERGEIYKIQVAVDAPPGSPMLLYNCNRSHRTFIHPDCAGYEAIQAAVTAAGSQGALEAAGGLKAYMYGKAGGRKGWILIDTSEAAPAQPWFEIASGASEVQRRTFPV